MAIAPRRAGDKKSAATGAPRALWRAGFLRQRPPGAREGERPQPRGGGPVPPPRPRGGEHGAPGGHEGRKPGCANSDCARAQAEPKLCLARSRGGHGEGASSSFQGAAVLCNSHHGKASSRRQSGSRAASGAPALRRPRATHNPGSAGGVQATLCNEDVTSASRSPHFGKVQAGWAQKKQTPPRQHRCGKGARPGLCRALCDPKKGSQHRCCCSGRTRTETEAPDKNDGAATLPPGNRRQVRDGLTTGLLACGARKQPAAARKKSQLLTSGTWPPPPRQGDF